MNSAELTYDNNSGKLDIRFRIPENAEYPFTHHTITKSKSDEYLMNSHSSPLQSSIISEGEKLPDPKHLGLENEYLETREIFMEHLRKFMKERGTPVSRIPQLGHKELDFHLLYKAVIARGGVEQVIRNRQWKEISTMFNFPSTCTNAGYTLRVTYLKFLFPYEQKFFFGKEDVVTHDEAEQMLDLRQNKKLKIESSTGSPLYEDTYSRDDTYYQTQQQRRRMKKKREEENPITALSTLSVVAAAAETMERTSFSPKSSEKKTFDTVIPEKSINNVQNPTVKKPSNIESLLTKDEDDFNPYFFTQPPQPPQISHLFQQSPQNSPTAAEEDEYKQRLLHQLEHMMKNKEPFYSPRSSSYSSSSRYSFSDNDRRDDEDQDQDMDEFEDEDDSGDQMEIIRGRVSAY